MLLCNLKQCICWNSRRPLLLLWSLLLLLLRSRIRTAPPFRGATTFGDMFVRRGIGCAGLLLTTTRSFYSMSLLIGCQRRMVQILVVCGVQRGGIVAALFCTQRSAHVAALEEAPVQTHQANLAIGCSAVIASIATDSRFECWRIALKSIFEHSKTTTFNA